MIADKIEAVSDREAYQERIAHLEKRERGLWFRYQELTRRVGEMEAAGESSGMLKIARKDLSGAHRRHQNVVHEILRTTRDRLFEEARRDDG